MYIGILMNFKLNLIWW